MRERAQWSNQAPCVAPELGLERRPEAGGEHVALALRRRHDRVMVVEERRRRPASAAGSTGAAKPRWRTRSQSTFWPLGVRRPQEVGLPGRLAAGAPRARPGPGRDA